MAVAWRQRDATNPVEHFEVLNREHLFMDELPDDDKIVFSHCTVHEMVPVRLHAADSFELFAHPRTLHLHFRALANLFNHVTELSTLPTTKHSLQLRCRQVGVIPTGQLGSRLVELGGSMVPPTATVGGSTRPATAVEIDFLPPLSHVLSHMGRGG